VSEQPEPKPNDRAPIVNAVCVDLLERAREGIRRYGVYLQPHNGRDALRDAYEEALDLCMYLKQMMVERDAPSHPQGERGE
jgi:hypothetical protein